MQHLLEAVAFREPARARRDLHSIDGRLDPPTEKQVESLLAASPDPDQVLQYLAAFIERHPEALDNAAASPSGLQHLTAIFGWSRFLSEELLQHPDWLETIDDPGRVWAARDFAAALRAILTETHAAEPDILLYAQFRRRQILRILLGDVLGLCTLSETTEQLSSLADALLDVS